MGQAYRKLFQEWEIAVIKKSIGESRKRWKCLARDAYDDLLQECVTYWYFSRGGYVPGREASRKTYLGRVIRNKIMDLIRERETDKRRIACLTNSLDEFMRDEDGCVAMSDRIGAVAGLEDPRNHIRETQLRMDVSSVLRKLTPDQKRLCRLLGDKGFTIKEASEHLKIPRGTVYEEVMRIRAVFANEGLADYLK